MMYKQLQLNALAISSSSGKWVNAESTISIWIGLVICEDLIKERASNGLLSIAERRHPGKLRPWPISLNQKLQIPNSFDKH